MCLTYLFFTHFSATNIISNAYGTPVDLTNQPDLVMNPEYASLILVHGMINGEFTGKKLSAYINETSQNFRGARAVVNGSFKAQEFADSAESIQEEYQKIIDALPANNQDDPTDELADIHPSDRKLYNMRPKEKLIAVEGAVIVCPNALIPPPMFY